MSVTSGFFNSLDGDRKYNAEQMSAIFDGIINDGVFSSIGTAFQVQASSGNNITVGIGRAWFNSTWVLNDSILPLTADDAELILNRYDAVVIEVDHSDSVRAGSIKIVKGTPASSPSYPTMTDTTDVHQHPIAYIYRTGGSSSISQSNITNAVGTSSCPYVTGILQTLSIDSLIAQWQDQWSQQTAANLSEFNDWLAAQKNEFTTWYNNLQSTLEGDIATNLSNQVATLKSRFDTLADEYRIYHTIQDSDGADIGNSYDDMIVGKIVYQIA